MRKAERIRKILVDFEGLKGIPAIRNPRVNKIIDNMRDASGNLVTANQEVVDVFAQFYETLYIGQPTNRGGTGHGRE